MFRLQQMDSWNRANPLVPQTNPCASDIGYESRDPFRFDDLPAKGMQDLLLWTLKMNFLRSEQKKLNKHQKAVHSKKKFDPNLYKSTTFRS